MAQPVEFLTERECFEFIRNQTGMNPFNGVGIQNRKDGRTLLRSVDDTFYYADDLQNPLQIQYTLFGRHGNQDVNENRFNFCLVHEDRDIFVYRRHQRNRQKLWTWYGQYKKVGMSQKIHPDINGQMRIIHILHLVPV